MFTVGDLVRVKDTEGIVAGGETGTITRITTGGGWNIDIRIGDDEIAFAEEELEPVFAPVSDVFDPVSKPEHYSKGLPEGVEVIDIIRAQKGSWELSNAIKYLLRAQFKGNCIQDLEKCVQYLTWEIERIGDPGWRDGTDD